MVEFSNKTLWCLEDAGWNPQYAVDISRYIHETEKAGCVVPDVIKQFLTRFGNLKIRVPLFFEENKPVFKEGLASFREFHLKPSKAAGREYCEEWKHISDALGVEAVYPIGEDNERMVLFMTPSGSVYESLDGTGEIILVGISGEAAIETLCS